MVKDPQHAAVLTRLRAALRRQFFAGDGEQAVHAPSDAALPPQPPRFSWDTVPVFMHSGNGTGPLSPATATFMARFPLVTMAGFQGPKPCCLEDHIAGFARDVKAANADTRVMYYQNTLINFPQTRLGRKGGNATVPEALLLHDRRGRLVYLGGCGATHAAPNHTIYDHRIAAMRAAWSSNVVDVVQANKGLVDGVFCDRSGGIDAVLEKDLQCYDFDHGFAAAWNEGHWQSVSATMASLRALTPTAVVIANHASPEPSMKLNTPWNAKMYEHYTPVKAATRDYVPDGDQLAALMRDGKNGLLVEVHVDDCKVGNAMYNASLAAYLIGASNYSYYACTKGWGFSDGWSVWSPDYNRPLGAPLGPANRTQTGWRRKFVSGTEVWLDTLDQTPNAWGSSCIRWADGHVTRSGKLCRNGGGDVRAPAPAPAKPVLYGTNIHFTHARAGEMDQLKKAFSIARMDFQWSTIEATPGVYNFAPWDDLHAELAAAGVRGYFILDYGPSAPVAAANGCQTGHVGPATASCASAFARYAVAAMQHFENATPPVVWELWNEPNTIFWGSKTGNVTQYTALAHAVAAAREAAGLAVTTTLVGPAAAGFGRNTTWDWLEGCAALGCFEAFDAISVHAYRSSWEGPETVLPDYARLRALVGSSSAAKPLISGEWGWSTCDPTAWKTGEIKNCPLGNSAATEAGAAKFLARQWLVNALAGVEISIYYDYLDDCTDGANRECRFGTVHNAYNGSSGATQPHAPKPAFLAAKNVQTLLGGKAFVRRLAADGADAGSAFFVLAFDGGTVAAWNAAGPADNRSCAVDKPLKQDCGYLHITKVQCEARGCCFALPPVPGTPQCFYHPTDYNATVSFVPPAATAAGSEAAGPRCWTRVGLLGPTPKDGTVCAASDGKVTIDINDEPCFLVPVPHKDEGTPTPPPTPAVPHPAKPRPNFSWETIPLAFHGANRSGVFNEQTVRTLAYNYSMVTIEKWYTKCGSLHPIQAGPQCDVEKAMYATFNKLKALNPKVTTIMYLNSMFAFSMYKLFGDALAHEAATGEHVLLRDKHGTLVTLCNDGNYFCNVTNWDWSKPAALDLWLSEVANATARGGVDGFFADHASAMLGPADAPRLCNGAGSKRKCYDFDVDTAVAFNQGHRWLVNHTQDLVAARGGPVVDGPWARWSVPACDFDKLRAVVQKGKDGTGPYVIEASRGACNPDESCLAAFLCAAAEYTYLACFADAPTFDAHPALARPLGAPLGDAQQLANGTWVREFESGTIARWYPGADRGTVQWAGEPFPPAPSPSPNVTAQCGKLETNMGQAQADLGDARAAGSAQECCDRCEQHAGCAVWAWHAEQTPALCHLHTADAVPHRKVGCFSGKLRQHA